MDVNNLFGNADLFLIDWILKGNVKPGCKVLDAGCGSGRNLLYFLQNNFDLLAIDKNEDEVHATNFLSRSIKKENIAKVANLEKVEYASDFFDFIICSRVLHFAENETGFRNMFQELCRVCGGNGAIFLTMSSVIGFSHYEELDSGKVQYPNGDIRLPLNDDRLDYILDRTISIAATRTVLFGTEHAETTLILQSR